MLSVDKLIQYTMQPQTTKAEAVNLALILSGLFAFGIIVGVLVTVGNMVSNGQLF